MKNVFRLKRFCNLDNFYFDDYFLTDKELDDFEKDLKECIAESNKDERLVSLESHSVNIRRLMTERGYEIVYYNDDNYYLEDDCPVANSVYLTKENKKRERV